MRVSVLVVAAWACCSCAANREPTELSHLHGLTERQVIAALGQPEHVNVFPVGEGQPEFRCELLNFYPPSNPANHSVKIRELLWRDGAYYQAVWFHQVDAEWRALDSVWWHQSIAF